MIIRLDHVAITVGDLDRSIEFYATHFGLDPYFVERNRERGPKHIAYLKSPQGIVELTYMPERPLGEGPPAPLEKQTTDQESLGADHHESAADLPAITPPDRR